MAKMFIGKYFPPCMVTKLRNEITNFRQRPDESLFKAWERYKLSIDRCLNQNTLPVTQIDTFYNGLTLRHRDTINAAAAQRSEPSSSITSSFDPKIIALKAEMAEINKNLMKVLQINQQVKAVTLNCKTCIGPHSYNDCPATIGQTQNVYAAGAYQGEATIWLDKEPPRSILTWEDLVSKFINQIFPLPKQRICVTKSPIFFKNPTRLSTKPGNVLRTYFIAAALEDKLDIRMNRFEKSLNEMKNSIVTPTAPLKAVTEVCVTYGSNHSYNQCPLTRGGNDYPIFHDNIQQFQTATVGNFIQNHQNVSNQIRPPGFHLPTQQNNNQNRFQS
nr:hypothetical protein [Tanacetum cinerariifolium]